jgi:hypothetical protein
MTERDRVAADSIREGLAATEGEVAAVESGWVIEHADSEPCAPEYLVVGDRNTVWSWSTDHLRAVRFARKQDADGVARIFFGLGNDHRICEHQWG